MMTRPKPLPSEVLSDLAVSAATKLQCFRVMDLRLFVKTVYASPSRINFHLDARKEAETVAAYPDICFVVDDFDSTFDTVVLSDMDHCYCVLLNAHDGAAFPSENLEQDCSSGSTVQVERVPEKIDRNKVTIFSGFVSYQMVREEHMMLGDPD